MIEGVYQENVAKYHFNPRLMMEALKKALAREGLGDMEIREINEPSRLKRWLDCEYRGMRFLAIGWDDSSYYQSYPKNYINRTVMALKWEIRKKQEIERMKSEKSEKSEEERMAEAPKPFIYDGAVIKGGGGK